MEVQLFDWDALSHEPDIGLNIMSYLSYKDLDNLEHSCIIFKQIFQRIRLWERKIKLEYPKFALDSECTNDEPNHIYWQLRYLDHHCTTRCYNICNICYDQTICFNITHCSLH